MRQRQVAFLSVNREHRSAGNFRRLLNRQLLNAVESRARVGARGSTISQMTESIASSWTATRSEDITERQALEPLLIATLPGLVARIASIKFGPDATAIGRASVVLGIWEGSMLYYTLLQTASIPQEAVWGFIARIFADLMLGRSYKLTLASLTGIAVGVLLASIIVPAWATFSRNTGIIPHERRSKVRVRSPRDTLISSPAEDDLRLEDVRVPSYEAMVDRAWRAEEDQDTDATPRFVPHVLSPIPASPFSRYDSPTHLQETPRAFQGGFRPLPEVPPGHVLTTPRITPVDSFRATSERSHHSPVGERRHSPYQEQTTPRLGYSEGPRLERERNHHSPQAFSLDGGRPSSHKARSPLINPYPPQVLPTEQYHQGSRSPRPSSADQTIIAEQHVLLSPRPVHPFPIDIIPATPTKSRSPVPNLPSLPPSPVYGVPVRPVYQIPARRQPPPSTPIPPVPAFRTALGMTLDEAVESMKATSYPDVSSLPREKVMELAAQLRQKAEQMDNARVELEAERSRELKEKRSSTAFRLKYEAKEAEQAAEKLHKDASDLYFHATNATKVADEIDVHKLHKTEAIEKVNEALRNIQLAGKTRLHVITGKPKFPFGRVPALRSAIQEDMRRQNIPVQIAPWNDAVLLVDLVD